jgi:hypothetical protein
VKILLHGYDDVGRCGVATEGQPCDHLFGGGTKFSDGHQQSGASIGTHPGGMCANVPDAVDEDAHALQIVGSGLVSSRGA